MSRPPADWSPTSWQEKLQGQALYDDPGEVAAVLDRLRALPPLVNSWEIEHLKRYLADAQAGRRFVLQGGDCAETLADCRPENIINKLKILLQMSLVLVHGGKRPVVRIGRFAGQYAKPRSSPTEVRPGPDGARVELPSYFGDLINRAEFTAAGRRADPHLMIEGYKHAALTLNFIRSLAEGGFADLHHPEYWDLSFFKDGLRAELPDPLLAEYRQTTARLGEALRFMEAVAEAPIENLTRANFFTSHEGLNLYYESAQTRTVPLRPGCYDLTTHLPWIGERTRALGGPHVEFFRGIENPVGVKLSARAVPDEVVGLCEVLNAERVPGKLLLIARMGAGRVERALPPLVEAVRQAGHPVVWMCDPMHGNTLVTASGIKTRSFDSILREVELSFDIHRACGTILSGVHFELTGEDVTECLGAGVHEEDLDKNYMSLCDPRLNYRQALEMAFRLAKRMGGSSAI
jgi:3-deoxy-7-phosphoheptulonate synthase